MKGRGAPARPQAGASSWDELNSNLQAELERNLDRRRLSDGRTARQALIAEREHLRTLPPRLPESGRIVPCVAEKYAIVTVDRLRYSVPSDLARCALLAKIFWDRIEIVDGDRCVATHARSYVEGAHVLDAMHVLRLLERTSWRVSGERGAAWMLGLKPSTLESRMRRLAISWRS